MSDAGLNNDQINWQAILANLMQKMDFTMSCLSEEKGNKSRNPNVNLPIFKGTFQEDVDEWLAKCKQIFEIHNITDDNLKARWLSTAISEIAHTWYRTLTIEIQNSYALLENAVKERFERKRNQIMLRKELKHLLMNDDIETFIKEFQEIVAAITNITEQDKIFYFLEGLKLEIAREVSMWNPSSLNEAISLALNHNSFSNAMDINTVHNGNYKNKRKFACYNCGKLGHIARNCWTQKRETNPNTKINPKNSSYYCGVVKKAFGDTTTINVSCRINGKRATALIDTGAQVTVVSCKLAQKMNLIVERNHTRLYGMDGSEFGNQGTTSINIEINNKKVRVTAIVADLKKYELLIGMDVLRQINAVIDMKKLCVYMVREHDNNLSIIEKVVKGHSRNKKKSKTERNEKSVDENEESFDEGELNHKERKIVEEENVERNESEMEEEIENSKEVEEAPKENNSNDEEEFFDASEFGEMEQQPMRISSEFGVEFVEKTEQMVTEYKDIFATKVSEVKEALVEPIEITMKDEIPIYTPQWRLAQTEQDVIDKEVESMLEADIIQPSTSPFNFPVIVVPKKDGSARVCVDFRELNKVTITDPFPIPIIDDILNRLASSKIFSTLDLKCGYWQIPLSKETARKTAFTTRKGHFEFKRLPFGLKNAPSQFSRIMQMLLGNLPFVEVYIDDVIIHSKDWVEHLNHLKSVFDKVKEASMKLNRGKCCFGKREIQVLGHVIVDGQIKMENDKIHAIKNMEIPTSKKEMQRFLGLANYYRKFINNFAEISKPLTALLREDSEWKWGQEEQTALDQLKNALISYPVLQLPNLSKPFRITTDASGVAIGGILGQVDDYGKEYVCGYVSRQLTKHEVNYTVSEKECLAIVWTIKQFSHFLRGVKFTIITDHAALQWLHSIKDPNGRLARWALTLQAYNYEVEYRKGTLNENADCLSRADIFVVNMGKGNNRDIYNNDALFKYVTTGKIGRGSSEKKIAQLKLIGLKYKFENGELKRLIDDEYKIIPPPNERNEIIEQCHRLGHFCLDGTIKKIQERYYWNAMIKDVKKIVDCCLECQKASKTKLSPAIINPLPVNDIFDRVGIDLTFGFPTSAKGNCGILVITDYLSKYPYAVAIKSKTSEEVASKLLEFIALFGPPKEILSDQGREFVNEIVHTLCTSLKIDRITTSSYYPQTNGLTERFNATLANCIRKVAAENPHAWDEWLPWVLLAYRSRTNSTTGHQPYELLFGKKMNWFENFEGKTSEVDDEKDILSRTLLLRNSLQKMRHDVRQKIKNDQEKMKNVRMEIIKNSHWMPEIGEWVLKNVEQPESKVAWKKDGPWEILGKTKLGNYYLRNKQGIFWHEAVPLAKLVKFSEENHNEIDSRDKVTGRLFEEGGKLLMKLPK